MILIFSSLNLKAQELLKRQEWRKIQGKYKNLPMDKKINESFAEALELRIGINKIKRKQLPHFKKIRVAVIDTGINIKHPVLSKYVQGRNPASLNDKDGHGSHVSGIISLLTNKHSVEIIPYGFYDQYKSGLENLKALKRELRKAIDDDVDIINMSLGGPVADKGELKLLKEAERKGIIVVVASGNEGEDLDMSYCNFNLYNPICRKNEYFPASYENLKNVISVSNYKKPNVLDKSSNYGKETVTLGTLGYKIPSFFKSNDIYLKRPYFMTGSSMATPIITSAIIRLKERYPYMKLSQIKHVLKINSFKDEKTKYGYFDYASFLYWMNNNYNYFQINPSKINTDFENFFEYYIFENPLNC